MEGDAANPMRGLSLLEVMLACLLLALSIFFTLTVFSGILRASTQGDARQEVVATLEVLGDYFRERARANWTSTRAPKFWGDFEGYVYSVDDLGRIYNPEVSSNPPLLDLRMLEIEIQFYLQDATGRQQQHSEKSLVSVPR